MKPDVRLHLPSAFNLEGPGGILRFGASLLNHRVSFAKIVSFEVEVPTPSTRGGWQV